jgi:hypothetical protein
MSIEDLERVLKIWSEIFLAGLHLQFLGQPKEFLPLTEHGEHQTLHQ